MSLLKKKKSLLHGRYLDENVIKTMYEQVITEDGLFNALLLI